MSAEAVFVLVAFAWNKHMCRHVKFSKTELNNELFRDVMWLSHIWVVGLTVWATLVMLDPGHLFQQGKFRYPILPILAIVTQCKLVFKHVIIAHRNALTNVKSNRILPLKDAAVLGTNQTDITSFREQFTSMPLHVQLCKALSNEASANLFQTYLSDEYCAESLQCWKQCTPWKKNFSQDSSAERIIDLFFKPESILEVSVNSKQRDEILNNGNKSVINDSIFDDCVKKLSSLMLNDNFMRFIVSVPFEECVRIIFSEVLKLKND